MKKIFPIILLTLTLSACSISARYGAVSTKHFDLNSPSLAEGKNVSYTYKLTPNDKGTSSIISALLEKNKCVVAFNNVNLYRENKFSSTVEFKGDEIIDRSIPGCK